MNKIVKSARKTTCAQKKNKITRYTNKKCNVLNILSRSVYVHHFSLTLSLNYVTYCISKKSRDTDTVRLFSGTEDRQIWCYSVWFDFHPRNFSSSGLEYKCNLMSSLEYMKKDCFASGTLSSASLKGTLTKFNSRRPKARKKISPQKKEEPEAECDFCR